MSKCHEEREKYQNYFEGLHKLADMRDMIEDINSGLAELDKHVQTNINDMTKRQGIYQFFLLFKNDSIQMIQISVVRKTIKHVFFSSTNHKSSSFHSNLH